MPAEVVVRSLRHVWKTLQPLQLPMAAVGGLALAAWKYVRDTRDVDLLVAVGQGGLDEILDRLRAADIRPKRDPPITKLGQLEIAQFLYEPPETFLDLQIDLLLARSGYHVEALARRVPVRLPGLDVEIAVLACEDVTGWVAVWRGSGSRGSEGRSWGSGQTKTAGLATRRLG